MSIRASRNASGSRHSTWIGETLALLWHMPLLPYSAFCQPGFFRSSGGAAISDVACCFGNNGMSAQVIADCRRLGIRTVLCIASDSDLAPDYRPGDHGLNDYNTPKWMAHYALENADHVFVQTEFQLRALAERFGRRGETDPQPGGYLGG